jgi:Flp pilus assembly protein TadG
MARSTPHPFSEQTMDSCGSTNRTRSAAQRLASEESGQIMMLTGLLLVIMLVGVALVIDIAHAQLVQRQLQAGVDAAALAAAQELPESEMAEETGHVYSPTPGSKNAVNTVDNATTTVNVRCITTIPGCNTRYSKANAVEVQSVAKVPTFFGRIVGVKDLTVRARATACYPCSVRPLDIMLVLDRTGSMCNGDHGPCTSGQDLDAAREGVKTFISMMDPKLDRVGLAVLPPVIGPSVWGTRDVPPCLQWKKDSRGRDLPHSNPDNCAKWTQEQFRNPDSPSDRCATPDYDKDYAGYDAYTPWWLAEDDPNYKNSDRAWYVVSSLSNDDDDGDPSDDYVKQDDEGNWDLNPGADIVQAANCLPAAGPTSYSMAIDAAQHELVDSGHGRANVQKVIVFFTDGGANTTPGDYGDKSDGTGYWANSPEWFNRPCGSGVEAAKRAKEADPDGAGPLDGTIIYTIGYGLKDPPNIPATQKCAKPLASGHQGSADETAQTWGRYPKDALKAMASNPANFKETENPGDLQRIFTSVAGQVLTNAARLVDNDVPDLLE